jgi:hypothetical protein
MHKPDFGKDRFEVTITVHENCQTFSTRSLDGNPITYQDIVGALETVKMSYFFEQSGINVEEYRKWQAIQNKKKAAKKINKID